MAYLTEADYTLFITKEDLDMILTQAAGASGKTNDQVRQFAESYAMAYVSSMLRSKYNIAGEYAVDASSGSRDMLIVGCTIDLTLCVLHKTINPRDIPELRQKACDDAKAWLRDVRNGDALISVPVNADPNSQVMTQINSQVKFISKPYQDGALAQAERNFLPPNFLL